MTDDTRVSMSKVLKTPYIKIFGVEWTLGSKWHFREEIVLKSSENSLHENLPFRGGEMGSTVREGIISREFSKLLTHSHGGWYFIPRLTCVSRTNRDD